MSTKRPASPTSLPPASAHARVDAGILDALVHGRHDDPFAVLGIHLLSTVVVIRALLPGAISVDVLDTRDRPLAALENQAGSGLFVGVVPRCRAPFPYRLRVVWRSADGGVGSTEVIDDPYRFPLLIAPFDAWLLAEGTHHRPYEWLGAHPMEIDGVSGTRFAVWAPAARRVSVVGGFNGWDGRRHMMRLRRECGIWEIFIPAVATGELYKYELLDAAGEIRLKADPFAFRAEIRPRTASVVEPLPPVREAGSARRQANALDAAISIYEVHLGSWRRNADGGWLGYRELGAQLIPYVRELGFTHIELMPIHEHPFDGSWGYQPTGLYAPTSRFGTPADLRAFVSAAHDAGLGVIIDWVPAHFPTDEHGLARFDGACLYEHGDPREGYHPDWNTLIYNYGRREVRNYLIGNALFWIERYGIDGLRVDAVASMLYRDYSRKEGEWLPNRLGGRENLEAIAFLRRMNHVIGTQRPEAITFAEESTAFPQVTRPPGTDLHSGGLGFHFKWNMGWMNDILAYMARDPAHRRYHHDQIRFSLMYAFNENFVLPLSHDEVVHGKGALLAKMPGDRWQQFANLRALYGYMWGHPGKKLLFMGCEFAQANEWNADSALPWHLLEEPDHAGVHRLVRDLNAVLRHYRALHELDVSAEGFAWISHDDAAHSLIAFERRARSGPSVLVICNFTPVVRRRWRVGVPQAGAWREAINTDARIYGGSGVENGRLDADAVPWQGRAHSVVMDLPPLATVMMVQDD